MRIATAEDFARARAIIEQRTTERIERYIAEAQAFATSPAYEKAVREIVTKARRPSRSDQ